MNGVKQGKIKIIHIQRSGVGGTMWTNRVITLIGVEMVMKTEKTPRVMNIVDSRAREMPDGV